MLLTVVLADIRPIISPVVCVKIDRRPLPMVVYTQSRTPFVVRAVE